MSRERRPGDVPCGQRTRHRRYRPQARPDRGPSRVAAGGNGRQSLGAVSPARELEGGNNPPARAPCLAPATRGPLRFWQDRSRVWRENSVERGASTGRDRPGMARSKKARPPRINRGTGDQRAGGQATCQPASQNTKCSGPAERLRGSSWERREQLEAVKFRGSISAFRGAVWFFGKIFESVKPPKNHGSA